MSRKRVSNLAYAFSVGKIRALEKFLMRKEVFEEARESSLHEALKLFVESNLYSDALLHIKDSQQLEMVLNEELLKIKKLIGDLLLDKGLWCIIELTDLNSAYQACQVYRSEFLSDYLKHVIDMHNIKTFLRFYVLKESADKLKQNLVLEGFVKREVFLQAYSQDIVFLLNRLEYVHKRHSIIDYSVYLSDAIEKLMQKNSFIALEKAISDFLIQMLKPAKYLSFGPEAIIAYYFAKVNEINLIRLIILAKLNGVSPDVVKERLNNVYV
ncbi:MAG: V-type ATPase subunit [Candidatus Omnitrophica bacterium]|nr:V-type ATPase subunit [Candidatus Omnitrophota bacterium]